jgi:hypothetical protein
MALAPSLTTVQINGTYINYEGTPIEGQIRFSTVEVLRNGTDDQMVAPTTVVVPLVNGSFSVTLPATNDPDVVPNPFEYTVEESFTNGRTYKISIPYTTSGSLDLADISPSPTLSTTYVSLIDATTWATLANNIDALDLNINQSTNKLIIKAYWLIPINYASYTALNSAFATYTALNANGYELAAAEISPYATTVASSASSAASSATSATTNATGTINPMLLIGG